MFVSTFVRLRLCAPAALLISAWSIAPGRLAQAEHGVGAAAVAATATADDGREALARMQSFRLAEGVRAELAAAEPLLANPVAFCFDDRGRIFVAETHRIGFGVLDNRQQLEWLDADLPCRTVDDRRDYLLRKHADNPGFLSEKSERIRLLEDQDGDGVFDHSTVFAECFNGPVDGVAAGVLWMGDRLWATSVPSVWELTDEDDNGQSDQQRELHTGFGVHTALMGHDLHGLCRGPDGKVYFSIGDRGVHVDTGEQLIAVPDMGSIFRCNPDGSGLELFASGYRNPQDLEFDNHGNLFTVDNNSDAMDLARVMHVVEGGDPGWRMYYQYLPQRGPWGAEALWKPHFEGQAAYLLTPMANLSNGPSGLAFNPGTGLPPEYDDHFFLCDFGGSPASSGIRTFRVEPAGATFELAKAGEFMWNLAVTDCKFGPDSNLYATDWVQGWSGTGKGRVYRFESTSPECRPVGETKALLTGGLGSLGDEELFKLLEHADRRVRQRAQFRLAESGQHAALLQKALAPGDTIPRLHALWACGQIAERSPELWPELLPLLADNDPVVRTNCARTLGLAKKLAGDVRDEIGNRLTVALQDDHPAVVANAAISLGRLGYRPALEALVSVLHRNNDDCQVVRHSAVMGLAGCADSDELAAAAADASAPVRLGVVLALRRHGSERIAEFLQDSDTAIVLEAARAIHDLPILPAEPALAGLLETLPEDAPDALVGRCLNANLRQRNTDAFARVVRFAMGNQTPERSRSEALDVLALWPEPSPRDRLLCSYRELPPVAEEQLWPAFDSLFSEGATESETALRLSVVAAELRTPQAFPRLARVIDSVSLPVGWKARALTALEHYDNETEVRKLLDEGLKSSEPSLRTASRELLVKRFPEDAVPELVAAIEQGSTPERQRAFAQLANLSDQSAGTYLQQWLQRLVDGNLPRELEVDLVDAARIRQEPELVALVQRYENSLAELPQSERYLACLSGGDSAEGLKQFAENARLSCVRCHALKPGVQRVGPNLSNIGAVRSRKELLESIVEPNKKIAEGFGSTVLVLDTGKIITGVLREENEEQIVLIDTDEVVHVVDQEQVEDRFEGNSAMPEGLAKLVTRRELRDLVEYLTTLRSGPVESGK